MKKIAYMFIISCIIFSSANITSSLQVVEKQEEQSLTRFDYDHRYAVILVGTYGGKFQELVSGNSREQYYEWYTGSTQRMFNILTEQYNVSAENIYVLLTEVKKEGYVPHSTFDSSKFVHYYNATKQNVTMVFNQLKDKMDNDDLLLVEIINHGGDDGGFRIPIIGKYIDRNTGPDAHDTYMALEKDISEYEGTQSQDINYPYYNQNMSMTEEDDQYKLYDHELGDLTKVIDARRILFIVQPCFSGGFINDLSKENHVIFTASSEIQMADDFLGPLNNGLDGSAEDLNNDGNISLAEIFEYTITHLATEGFDPMIDDNGDKVGHTYIGDGDGIVASGIYNLSYEMIDYNMPEYSKPFSRFDNCFPILRQLFQIFRNR